MLRWWLYVRRQRSLKHPASLPTSSTAAAPPKAVLHDHHCPLLNHIPMIREVCKICIFPFAWTFLIIFFILISIHLDTFRSHQLWKKKLKWGWGISLYSDLDSHWGLTTHTRSRDAGAGTGTADWWVRLPLEESEDSSTPFANQALTVLSPGRGQAWSRWWHWPPGFQACH